MPVPSVPAESYTDNARDLINDACDHVTKVKGLEHIAHIQEVMRGSLRWIAWTFCSDDGNHVPPHSQLVEENRIHLANAAQIGEAVLMQAGRYDSLALREWRDRCREYLSWVDRALTRKGE